MLRTLSNQFSFPWVCIGDFNEILFADWKQGWLDRPKRQMQGFREAFNFCRLKDLGYNGFPFTWCNRRPGNQNVWIRLDRGVATIDWILTFPSSRIHHLDAYHSDHKPILLNPDSEVNRFYKKRRSFRFEAMWLRDKSCEEVIRDSCGDGMAQPTAWGFNSKVLTCQSNLRVWNKKTFGHVRNSLKQKLAELKLEEENGGYRNNPSQIQGLRDDI